LKIILASLPIHVDIVRPAYISRSAQFLNFRPLRYLKTCALIWQNSSQLTIHRYAEPSN
jgi:hypothetical protein